MAELVDLAREGLLLSVVVCLPVVAAAALVSLLSGLFQAVTQIHDGTLSHLPRLLAVALVLTLAGPWMGSEVLAFTARIFGG